VIHQFETIIVGSGGSGLYAALEASQRSQTAVLSKLIPVRSHTGAAQGGISAALGNVEEDKPEWHAFDTVKGGDYLVDQQAAKILAEEAIQAVYDLENRGLPFNRTPEGRIDQRRFGGHTRNFGESPVRRACYAADRTGHMILQTLYQQCIKNDVSFYDEFQVLDLILDDNRCKGVVAVELATGELHIFAAKAVLFATGGFGRIFKITSNAHANTGDGPAICARRGIPLEDMEFFQFHPTGIKGLGILISEAVRGEGGILRDRDGKRFMEHYSPTLLDLAPRDIVARSILTEIRAGKGTWMPLIWARKSCEQNCRTSLVFVKPIWVLIRPTTQFRCCPRHITRWVVFRPIPLAELSKTAGKPSWKDYMLSANVPAYRYMVPIGWGPIACLT